MQGERRDDARNRVAISEARNMMESRSEMEEDDAHAIYNQADFISGPILTEGCTLPPNILEFHYSFGYDCQQHSNLCVLDKNTLAFMSGNLLHFCHLAERKTWFRRSASGRGLGHIAKNPHHSHLAVGESGSRPHIIIYEWLSMDIVALLKRGAEEKYTYINYSPDGELLCSVGGPPDNYFTVWNWRESRIMLRAKSSGQDVFHAAFSSFMPGHITSSGSAHVRFWKMAQTFTGLKLEGAQGRFGNTEVSDVIGVLAMPDGKVVSGCEWGNILVWEAGLIKVEVTKKGRKGCHTAPIAQFEYCNGELVSLGMDGFVKVWYFETIDLADPPDDDRFVEVEPIFELEVSDSLGTAALLCMRRRDPHDDADNTWFVQDAGGGLWELDLSLAADAPAPKRLLTAHSGGVPGLGLGHAPHAPYVATLGREGRLLVYSHTEGLVIAKSFPAPGAALLWLPLHVASSGSVLVLAFGDGVVRVVAVDLAGAVGRVGQHGGTGLGTADRAALLQAAKAHGDAATALGLSDSGSVLASGGADRTVFLFAVQPRGQFAALSPIGFVEVTDVVSFLTFKPEEDTVLLAGCVRGQVTEIKVPQSPSHDVSISFKYTEATLRTFTYKSVKSQLRREQQLRDLQQRKEERLERRRQQLEELKLENSDADINEEAFLEAEDSESEIVLEPLYVPTELGAVRWARYLGDDSVWLSVTGYDSGYLYEYRLDSEHPDPDPARCVLVPGGDDSEICSLLYYPDKTYVFLGMGDGVMRVARVKPDSADFSDNWSLGMHNPSSGPVTAICLSPDSRTLFSAAPDGNLFMYNVHPERGDPGAALAQPPPLTLPAASEEVYGADVSTLEEQHAKTDLDRKMKEAAELKHHMEQILWGLGQTYNTIIRRNRALPASQIIPHSELELDPRIAASTQQALETEALLLRAKLAYPLERACLQYSKLASFYTDAVIGHGVKVQGVRKNVFVETIRQRKLTAEFEAAKALAEWKLQEVEQRGRAIERKLTLEEIEEEVTLAPAPVESFLRGITAFEHKFNARLRRLIDKYHSRKFKREHRQIEWAQFMRKKPDLTKNDPEDEETIREAVKTIGDYRLKSDPDYRVPEHLNTSTAKKFQELLQVRKQLDDLFTSFNAEVLSLRERKAGLVSSMTRQAAALERMHRELPTELRLQPPLPPTIDVDEEYPERKYQVTEEDIEAEIEKTAPARRPASKPTRSVEDDAAQPEDLELEVLLGDRSNILQMNECESWERLVESLPGPNGLQRVDSEVDISTLTEIAGDDGVNTGWENEMRAARLIRKVWEQQQLVSAMNQEMDALDDAIEALAAKRLLMQRDAALLRHRLLVLHQELIIIKACEDKEDLLAAKVAVKERERLAVQNQLNIIQNKLDVKARDILRCQEKEKEVQLAFVETVGDYPYLEYLKKVFKKKFRAPKSSTAGSSESSTSSSSESDEEDDEGASLDSNEAGPVRFDDTSCPPGCSPELFDLTLSLRAQRHEAERDIVEHRRVVELQRREQAEAAKRLQKAEEGLATNQQALEAFRREKQQRLNEVETLVILKFSQLQHCRPDGKFEQLRNTLVFNTAVLAELDRRKQQLDEEAKAQRAKHKKNRTHLHRMMVDVNYMRSRLRTLRHQIEDAQFRKFGCVVDVTEVEHALLKRFIWDLRSSADEIRAEFQGLIANIQADVRKKFDELKKAIEENTERQNLLLVLTDERNRLLQAAGRMERLKESEQTEGQDDDPGGLDDDISELRDVLAALTARRDELLRSAARLRQKGTLLPPLSGPASRSRPSPSHYHGSCGAEIIPPPPRPWPPACVSALKHPMYLGPPQRPVRSAPPASPCSPAVARRAAVCERLEMGEQVPVAHPHPTGRRSLSLDSISQGLPGFLSADLRVVSAIASEEELAMARRSPTEPEQLALTTDTSVEELFRRIPSKMAQTPVSEFLERLGSHDADEVMLQVEQRLLRGLSTPPNESPTSDEEEQEDPITEDLDSEELDEDLLKEAEEL